MAKDSVGQTFMVAFLLCVVCSVLVSSAAVLLRPRQELNKEQDIKKNLLMAAGLVNGQEITASVIEDAYKKITPVVIDLSTGERAKDVDPQTFDPAASANDPASVYEIPSAKDLAKIRSRSKYALVYLVKEEDRITQVVLPVHGKGLYSTLYGFLALSADTKTVSGFAFYDQGETPGLGGEVDNPLWKAQWPGKTVYDDNWQPNIRLVKGGVVLGSSEAGHQVDAISGATMTSRGVENLLLYWLGSDGYAKFLSNFRKHGDAI